MAELFGCSADNISLHLKNIYAEKELNESATAEDFSAVQIEGNREVIRNVRCYSLEAIIAVDTSRRWRRERGRGAGKGKIFFMGKKAVHKALKPQNIC